MDFTILENVYPEFGVNITKSENLTMELYIYKRTFQVVIYLTYIKVPGGK